MDPEVFFVHLPNQLSGCQNEIKIFGCIFRPLTKNLSDVSTSCRPIYRSVSSSETRPCSRYCVMPSVNTDANKVTRLLLYSVIFCTTNGLDALRARRCACRCRCCVISHPMRHSTAHTTAQKSQQTKSSDEGPTDHLHAKPEVSRFLVPQILAVI